MNKIGRAPVLLLTTTGRRSGQQRTAPVLFQRDGESVVVIGSNAGNKEPGWSFNLKANPEAEIEIGPKRRRVRARVSEGEERERLWQKMNAQYGGFDGLRPARGRGTSPCSCSSRASPREGADNGA